MDISSSNIVKLNLRNVYSNNQLYLKNRKSNCYFQEGLRLVKLYDEDPKLTTAIKNLIPAIKALRKAICIDKYNEDAKYVLQYAIYEVNSRSGTGGGSIIAQIGCTTDLSGCCALFST